MMKGPLAYAVAVRKANGETGSGTSLVESAARKRIAKIPCCGVVTMARCWRSVPPCNTRRMRRWRTRKAFGGREGPGQGAKSGGLAMAGAMAMALLLGIGLFFLLPLYATISWPPGPRPGLDRLQPRGRGDPRAVFVLYIVGITWMKDIGGSSSTRRGAQGDQRLRGEGGPHAEAVRKCPRLHRGAAPASPVVMVISILVFLSSRGEFPAAKALLRLPLIPRSRNLLRGAAAVGEKDPVPWFRALVAPGLWLQRLTTRSRTCPDRGGDRVVPARSRPPGSEVSLVG